MLKRIGLSILLLIMMAGSLAACGGATSTATPVALPTSTQAPAAGQAADTPVAEPPTPDTTGQDQHITVQHILIGFKDAVGFQGNPPPKAAARTQDQAKTLAYDLLKRAQAGEDFDKLVAENTDDQAPGIYSLSNFGVTVGQNEYKREGMVAAFGDVGFSLKVGQVGIADYDVQKSPFGYHVIKRLQTKPVETKVVPNTTGQDQHITVQHILIGFKDAVGFQGNPPPKAAARTQDDAKKLAYEILDRAKKGENYDDLVKQYTDDQAPGIYSMSNIGATPGTGEYPREGMVAAFGNVGFTLKVGEIGIADYDPTTSPFGYHIIKRVK